MNNPNPFVPEGSILEQQSKRRSRLKLAVFCLLAFSVAGLTGMLIQGCKREQPADMADMPSIDTNTIAEADTNMPTIDTNVAPAMPPAMGNMPMAVTPPPVESSGSEYVVVKGDTLGKIAKKNGVTLKALQAANPGVVPTKLQIGQKLSIPPGGGTAGGAAATDVTGGIAGSEVYVVKSNDNLTKIAKRFGTTIKALESANNLSTSKIKVGQKLKIPAKAEAAAMQPAPVESVPQSAPMLPGPAPAK